MIHMPIPSERGGGDCASVGVPPDGSCSVKEVVSRRLNPRNF
jgi:hypothetical protein